MAQVSENTWVVDPEDGHPVFLAEGDDIPAWADDQVGDHIREGGEDAEPTQLSDQTVGDLRKEIARRNAEREEADQIQVPSRAKQADLVAALEEDDRRQAEKSESAGAGDGEGRGQGGSPGDGQRQSES